VTAMKWMIWIIPVLELAERAHGQQAAQVQVQPQIVGRPVRDGQVTTVFLAPRYVTAIRMPEPINLSLLSALLTLPFPIYLLP
jgi:hypothetical protein